MTSEKEVAAVSAVVREGERFLLVQRARPPANGLFAFPGGRVETDESDEGAVRRELLEETGLEAAEIVFLCAVRIDGDDGRRYRLKVFRIVETRGVPCAGDDAAHLGWYTLKQMRALPVTPSTLALAEEIAAGDAISLHGDASPAKRRP